jgi:signal transduction histidine kinase
VLDIRTLYVAHVAVIVTAGTVMLLSRRWQPGMRNVGTWGGAAVCLGVGMALTALRGIAPDWLTVLVANGISAMCPLMIWNGVRKFNGRTTRWPETLTLAAMFVASLAYFLYADESLSARIVIASVLLAVGSGASAYELLRWTNPALRRMSWTASAALMLVLGAQLARAVMTLFGASQSDLFAPTFVNQVSYLAGIVVSSSVIFCLAMMANQQLQIEVADRSAELERIARDRDHARLRAEQANRAKSVFLTMMSHELRTPLNVILGFSELGPAMPAATPPERIKEYFGLIRESGEHLLRMINDILDLSKVEAGKMEIECADLDIDYVVNSTVRLVSQQAINRGQHLKVAIDSPPPALFADERAVRQILFNLLSNAVRFTPEGGTVRVHAGATAEGGAELVVSDTGVGIPRDQIARLTQPFEQIDNSYQRAHGGTGLGLPLVDALVRLHGGTLTIDSEIDAGTRVSVLFPPGPEAQRSRAPSSLLHRGSDAEMPIAATG